MAYRMIVAGQVRIFFREYLAVAYASMGLRSATFYRCLAHALVVVIATHNSSDRHEMSITRGYTT